jgi:glucose-6-phosphate dehydrogenase assembly protein OpcA
MLGRIEALPDRRWSARATSVREIQVELERIWASTSLIVKTDAGEERHIAARTNVMNLVAVARGPELGMHCGAVLDNLSGRHPSRAIVVTTADPDGPAWIDARIDARCVLPRPDAAEICAETIHLTAGGESGRHLEAIVAPLLIHDLPVTIWWPGQPQFGSALAADLLAMADRLAVDGTGFRGDGIETLRAMADLVDWPRLSVTDFALLRQARWREAIASAFDHPELLPFVHGIRAITIRYAVRQPGGQGTTNIIKPLYHVAWLGSRLGMTVVEPLTRAQDPAGGYDAILGAGRRLVPVALRPVGSDLSPGSTVEVDLQATRSTSTLEVMVSAEAQAVTVRATRDRRSVLDRRFMEPRATEADLLGLTIEAAGRDPVRAAALRLAAALAGHHRSA